MKLNLVTLAAAIIILSFLGMHAAHLPLARSQSSESLSGQDGRGCCWFLRS